MKFRISLVGLCFAACGAVSAEATPIYVTGTSLGFTTSTVGAVTFANFDSPVNAFYATISGGTIDLGSDPGAGGHWITASDSVPGVVTINFTGLEDYFGFYWGSNDGPINQVNLFNGATLLATITGPGGFPPNAFFNITAGNTEAYFDRITLTAPLTYFEVDNLAVRSAPTAETPEPASLLLLGTGIAAVARRRFAKRA